MWLHLDLIRPLVDAISQTYTTVEYAFVSIPTYPSGQIGFIVAGKGRGSCSVPLRMLTDEEQENMRYYTADIHRASFVLPAFAKRAILGHK